MLYLPKSWDPSRDEPYPVIVYLHGAGGVGNPSWALEQGLPRMLSNPKDEEERALFQDSFDFIIVFPMAFPRIKDDENGTVEVRKAFKHPNGRIEVCDGFYLTPCQHWKALRPRVLTLLDWTLANLHGDRSRVYLTGLSIGGKGVLELAWAERKRFAAVVPVCGYLGERGKNGLTPAPPEEFVKAMAGMPMWLFHSKDDTMVNAANSQLVFDAMSPVSGQLETVKFTQYDTAPPGAPQFPPGQNAAGHAAFELAYKDPGLYPWLLQWRTDT
mmetsp:Transcript_76164/g.236597  ORF Transcript_76164/g.236597 Transcript_76164/m.236597 type:complete len:271 (-) Transcript_76164:36-848(-)